MPEIKNFIYCMGTKSVARSGDEQTFTPIEGIQNCLLPDYLPGNYSFSVVFSLLDLEPGEEYFVEVSFMYEKKEVARVEDIQLIGGTDNKYNVPEKFFGYQIAIDFRNVLLNEEGVYHTIVSLNGEEKGDYPIYVKAKQVSENV